MGGESSETSLKAVAWADGTVISRKLKWIGRPHLALGETLVVGSQRWMRQCVLLSINPINLLLLGYAMQEIYL